jgi:hypothetical protein
MDPFEPAGYIPIDYNEIPKMNETTMITMCVFIVIYMSYLICMLNCFHYRRH